MTARQDDTSEATAFVIFPEHLQPPSPTRPTTPTPTRLVLTDTLASECAACVRAAGFQRDADLPARAGWDNGPGSERRRVEVDLFGADRTPLGPKVRWHRKLAA